MDDPDKMDLALNSDFDSSLLNCWDSNPTKNDGRRGSMTQSPRSNHEGGAGSGGASWDSRSSPRFARLPSFTMMEDADNNSKNNAAVDLDSNASVGEQQQQQANKDGSSSNAKNAGQEGQQSSNSNSNHQTNNNNNNSNHPQTIIQTSEGNNNNNNTHGMHPLAIPSSANCPPHVVNAAHQAGHVQMQTMMGIQNALWSQLGGPAAAFAAGLSLPTTTINQDPAQQQQQQQASSQQDGKQMQQQQMQNTSAIFFTGNNNNPVHQQQQQQQPMQPSQQQQQQNNADNNNTGTAQQSVTPPPFYLFDAPVELRVNFMQSQRMHGIPVSEDSNSYHYGVAVNGFHPQQSNSNTISSAASSSGTSMNHSVQLVDARHGNRKAGRIKNEREQRRAQKITELIEQLRDKMEKGGWKVEVKSKFHTLSSCADYVKHLIKVTKEKEEAVCKAKSDLQMKERKVEEEKNLQQESRSDPESVMSSLTSSTGDSGTSSKMHHSTKKVSSESSSDDRQQRKRKSSSDGSTSNKKSRKALASEHSGSSGEEQDSQELNQQSLDKTTSSVSDVTESKGSSSSGNDPNQRSDDDEASGTPSSISASSSAAVVQHGKKHRTKHADVVIKERSSERQHKFPTEVTSLEESFVLDYQEVFVKSNVPQIIATTAGRIVAWNDFFLKATGFSKSGVKGLTIFSLVKQEKLSNLFEIVAKALRDGKPSNESTADGSSENAEGEEKWDYAGMTLPCMEFPSASKGKACAKYVTVTLMADEDPRKRLFHCVFTDCPGTDTCSIGSITPELLSLLFTRHLRNKLEKSESRKGDKASQKV